VAALCGSHLHSPAPARQFAPYSSTDNAAAILIDVTFVRVLRTPSSERHILRRLSADFAALDLHYLPDGAVQATLVLFEGSGVDEETIPDLLTLIDEILLPEVRMDQKNLFFTVVIGRVLGAFQAERDAESATAPQ
jgi:hypothetical protein